jgi:hypothetical protein
MVVERKRVGMSFQRERRVVGGEKDAILEDVGLGRVVRGKEGG